MAEVADLPEGGSWKTINGSPVYFKDGVAVAGAAWAVKAGVKDPAHVAADSPKKPVYKIPKTAPGMLIDFEVFKTYSLQQAEEAQQKGKAGKTTDPVYHAYGVMWQHKVEAEKNPTPANASKYAASKDFYNALKNEAKTGKLNIQPKPPEPKPEPQVEKSQSSPIANPNAWLKAAPTSLSGYSKVKVLGGSSKAELWQNASGDKVVVKKPLGGIKQVEAEINASSMYNAAGIATGAPTKIGGTVVSPFVNGTTLGAAITVGGSVSDELKTQLGDGFLMDALVANWDAVGAANDNVLVSNGKLIRIDTGGSLDVRAQGKPKPYTHEVKEFDSMVSHAPTQFQREAFQAVKDSPERLQAQMDNINKNSAAIIKAAGNLAVETQARIVDLNSRVKARIAGLKHEKKIAAGAAQPYAGGTAWKDVKNLATPELAKAIPNLDGVIPNTQLKSAVVRATPQFSALRAFTGHLYSSINSGQAPKDAKNAMEAVKALEPAQVSGLARGLKFGSGMYDGNTKLNAYIRSLTGDSDTSSFISALRGTPAEKNKSNGINDFDKVAVAVPGIVHQLDRPLSSFSTKLSMANNWAGGSHNAGGTKEGIDHWTSTDNGHSRGVVLRCKETTQSRDVKRISQHASEDEHVMLQGWKFKPTRAALIGGNLHIEIEEVL
jgi:hypothetical protein